MFGTALFTLAALSVVMPAADASAGSCASANPSSSSRFGSALGLVRPQRLTPGVCRAAVATALPFHGTPPLLNHGGPVMSVPSVGSQVVVTPIYWAPAGFSFTTSYKTIVNAYISNLAADSGKFTNVFSSLAQYPGSNGATTYKIVAGAPISDAAPYPTTGGCTPNSGPIYADNSGYTRCLDDAQVMTETDNLVAARLLPRDYGHLYVMFTPKHVESCISPDGAASQACTLNSTASAAYCAYHSAFFSGTKPTIYADMPFPIYASATGFSCTAEGTTAGSQAPNGDLDADVEVSPLSHEMAEAFTDPTGGGWYDSTQNENGDDCAYIYGTLSGATAGQRYNQVINGAHYLTQEEFSNAAFAANRNTGCVQSQASSTNPTVSALSPKSGPLTGGQTVTITGTNFTAGASVRFASTPGTAVVVVSSTRLTVRTPARVAGAINTFVTTSLGTSAGVPADVYTFAAAPSVTAMTPRSGTRAGGQTVTITGHNFTPGTSVRFASTPGTAVVVVSSTKLTVRTPARVPGAVNTFVTTPSGTSAPVAVDVYTFT